GDNEAAFIDDDACADRLLALAPLGYLHGHDAVLGFLNGFNDGSATAILRSCFCSGPAGNHTQSCQPNGCRKPYSAHAVILSATWQPPRGGPRLSVPASRRLWLYRGGRTLFPTRLLCQTVACKSGKQPAKRKFWGNLPMRIPAYRFRRSW